MISTLSMMWWSFLILLISIANKLCNCGVHQYHLPTLWVCVPLFLLDFLRGRGAYILIGVDIDPREVPKALGDSFELPEDGLALLPSSNTLGEICNEVPSFLCSKWNYEEEHQKLEFSSSILLPWTSSSLRHLCSASNFSLRSLIQQIQRKMEQSSWK